MTHCKHNRCLDRKSQVAGESAQPLPATQHHQQSGVWQMKHRTYLKSERLPNRSCCLTLPACTQLLPRKDASAACLPACLPACCSAACLLLCCLLLCCLCAAMPAESRVAGECAQPPASKRTNARALVFPTAHEVRLVAAAPALLIGQVHPRVVDAPEPNQQLDGLHHLLRNNCACGSTDDQLITNRPRARINQPRINRISTHAQINRRSIEYQEAQCPEQSRTDRIPTPNAQINPRSTEYQTTQGQTTTHSPDQPRINPTSTNSEPRST